MRRINAGDDRTIVRELFSVVSLFYLWQKLLSKVYMLAQTERAESKSGTWG